MPEVGLTVDDEAQSAIHRLPALAIQSSLLSGVLALLTGFPLLAAYSPSAVTAHERAQAISRIEGPLRNMHHWFSAAAILLGGIYLISALFTGSHRKPFQWVWVAALMWMGTAMAFQLTGHLLPWDQHAVSTAVQETGIAGGMPGIGPELISLSRGGEKVGPTTLKIWFVVHLALAVILPVLVVYLWRNSRPFQRKSLAVPALVILISFFLFAPLGQGATSADYESFAARPEWYILPMHSLLVLFEKADPSLGYLGSAVLPGFTGLLLLAMPWLDRGKLGKPVAGALVFGALALFGYSIGQMAPVVGQQIAVQAAGGGAGQLNLSLIAKGKDLFAAQGCGGCHKVQGKGGKSGPDLTNELTRHPDLTWQILHLKNPEKMSPGSTMPSFDKLTDQDLKALANYVVSRK